MHYYTDSPELYRIDTNNGNSSAAENSHICENTNRRFDVIENTLYHLNQRLRKMEKPSCLARLWNSRWCKIFVIAMCIANFILLSLVVASIYKKVGIFEILGINTIEGEKLNSTAIPSTSEWNMDATTTDASFMDAATTDVSFMDAATADASFENAANSGFPRTLDDLEQS
ncbi:uncharacterized protein NEMAJ01_0201 [Nematocida major]|uniref:uncharacterized protein n=1 Tax=Nematocida major TaxID=1912982 RepID=UPI0020076624|nr:uncharacterized protein NEMAJ01_0201 [Nematocida major]KAH9385305.1 hypothetical protein NEMAJ01_0201 [Nematocida major]